MKMERKKSQILFNFLPNDTFDHAHANTIGRVTEIQDEDDGKGDLPINYIIDRIQPKLDGWDTAPNFDVRGTDVVVPGDVEFEIFPLKFQCARCKVVNTRSRSEVQKFGTRESNDGIRSCDSCTRTLTDIDQQQLVTVCKCGRLEDVWVPSHCDNRGTKLIRRGSSLGDAFWVCECGHMIGRILNRIPDCNCGRPGSNREIKVHSASTTFYPQTATFVNIGERSIDRLRDSEQFRRDTVVDYFVEDDPADIGDDDGELSDEAEELLAGLDDNLRSQVRDNLDDQREEIEERRQQAREFTEQFDDTQLQRLSEEIYEYRQIYDEEVDHLNLEQLYKDASNQQNVNRGLIGQYRTHRDALNLDEVRLLQNFPVTSVVYGYSRLSPVPESDDHGGVQLRAFEGQYGNSVYSLTSNAEAISISLDPEAVLEWILENDEELTRESITSGETPIEDFTKWLTLRLSPSEMDGRHQVYPYNQDIGPESPVENRVLTLLHTLSHLFINAIDSLSGYSRESLVEYTLPRTLTFVIYKRSDTDFSLGALFSLVENNFLELVDYISHEEEDCMYDPVCKHEEGGACEGCLYISTLSCRHQNCNLSRATVFGGEFFGTELTGFFDIDV